ncbi:twin-arginine translocase TatA/TatE family subunit [Streptomyces sp. NPDC059900]|uniref:twin-arginine translocase TatA/TatE family subunit n=1 Tax=Streptomyces sp. NPDC059900 TaxID=3155816 RepID=UPI00343B8C52
MFGLSEIGVILIVIVLLLCVKKLPELARSAGKSARILKAEAKSLKDKDTATDNHDTRDTGERQGATPPRIIPGETVAPRDTEQGPRPQ